MFPTKFFLFSSFRVLQNRRLECQPHLDFQIFSHFYSNQVWHANPAVSERELNPSQAGLILLFRMSPTLGGLDKQEFTNSMKILQSPTLFDIDKFLENNRPIA